MAFFLAKQIRQRHVGVVEKQLRGVVPFLPKLFKHSAPTESIQPFGFDHDERYSFRAGASFRFRGEHDQIRRSAVGYEGFRSVNSILVADNFRRSLNRLHIGPASRFRHRQRADTLSGDQLGHPAPVLLLRAESKQIVNHYGLDAVAPSAVSGAALFVENDGIKSYPSAAALVFFRH